jgi:hypothetical protein
MQDADEQKLTEKTERKAIYTPAIKPTRPTDKGIEQENAKSAD